MQCGCRIWSRLRRRRLFDPARAVARANYEWRPATLHGSRLPCPVLHPWQENMPNVADVVRASQLASGKVVVVPVPGNWMVPESYARATEAVADVLETNGLVSGELTARATVRATEVRAFGEELQAHLNAADASKTPVLCHEMLAPFVEWAGFSVAGTFGRSENLSVGDVDAAVQLGKARAVALVIDNLQGGDEKMGAALATELGAHRVVVSNFPGGLPDTDTWDRAITRNVELLIEALQQLEAPAA